MLERHHPTKVTLMSYRGILPAMQCPFDSDLEIDEPELRRFASWLAGHMASAASSPMGTRARCLH
jgi:dihydrodipicolinate synthase/N-acetylneuraminate lyase